MNFPFTWFQWAMTVAKTLGKTVQLAEGLGFVHMTPRTSTVMRCGWLCGPRGSPASSTRAALFGYGCDGYIGRKFPSVVPLEFPRFSASSNTDFVNGKEPTRGHNLDEAVAYGVQAGIFER